VTLNNGDHVLLKDQSAPAQNGIYTWFGASTPLVRRADADVASEFELMFDVGVREGTANGGKYFVYTQTGTVTLDTTALTFAQLGGGGGSVSSVALTAPTEFSVAGSPITSTGTLAITKANQNANAVYSGPTTGSPAAPTFRAMVPADVPVMVASGASHASGAAPDPGVTAGTTKFLREDATWQVPAGGGGGSSGGSGGSGALVPIQTILPLTAVSATLQFSNIPQTGFRNLRLLIAGRGDTAATNITIALQASGDAGSNYDWGGMFSAATVSAEAETFGASAARIGLLPAATATAGRMGTVEVRIPSFTNTVFHKALSSTNSVALSSTSTNLQLHQFVGVWRSTAAVTSLTITASAGNFDVGTYACLYGEMDTAGVLLTPASNLLYQTTLTATAASIDTGTLSQSYRDIQVVFDLRTDAGSQTVVNLRFNGDTTAANYTSSGGGGSNPRITVVASAAQTTDQFTPGSILVTDYASATNKHASNSLLVRPDNTVEANSHFWTPAAAQAITSIQIIPNTGNFVAGSTVRVYGLPAAAGGASTGTGTRLRVSANQSIADATDSIVAFDTEDSDADNQHYTSAANLTGTVAKTAASQTLAGTTTAFLTELAVGQVISVPGTAAEKRVVIAIASNTSLTVSSAFANSASGQTAARVNSAIAFRQPGQYEIKGGGYWASNATGFRKLAIILNDTTPIAQQDTASIGATAMGQTVSVQRPFQQWDFVELQVRQNSGGALNLTADERTFFSSNARPTVIVAVPYVLVQDVKSQGTQGGNLTSGAWRTRDLNTLTDSAGIATLSSNQLVLPPGTYRTSIRVPARAVGTQKARLQNITAATTTLPGSNARDDNGAQAQSDSWIHGRFSIGVATTFEVQQQSAATNATNGFGIAANFTGASEIYTEAEFWKEA